MSFSDPATGTLAENSNSGSVGIEFVVELTQARRYSKRTVLRRLNKDTFLVVYHEDERIEGSKWNVDQLNAALFNAEVAMPVIILLAQSADHNSNTKVVYTAWGPDKYSITTLKEGDVPPQNTETLLGVLDTTRNKKAPAVSLIPVSIIPTTNDASDENDS